MSGMFSASEVIQVAIKIEENGEEFYRGMAKKFSDKAAKDTFNSLADEEIKHRRIFEEMVSTVESYEPPESFPGEYFQYLRSYAQEHIFTKEKSAQLKIKQFEAVKEAIEFAIGMELDSIHYYTEAKSLVPQGQRVIIDKVIEEERRHYLKLTEAKKTL